MGYSQNSLRPDQARPALTFRVTAAMAIVVGVGAGILELALVGLKARMSSPARYHFNARDALWSVPLVLAFMLFAVGTAVWGLNRITGRRIPARASAWVMVSLGLWGALLRLPLDAWASLILALGLGLEVSRWVVHSLASPRRARIACAGAIGLGGMLFGASTAKEHVAQSHSVRSLPTPSGKPLNVVILVWDTVRAPSMQAFGYPRENTPHLEQLASEGVRYRRALAPAPWTLPTHSTLFTGRWPWELNTQWSYRLDGRFPTLAEFLLRRGYQTVAFVGNTTSCSYETGLDRGFLEYRDYPLDFFRLAGRTFLGNWVGQHLVWRDHDRERKWLGLQSRDAKTVTDEFVGWLSNRRADRPFFAFLNLFDAHEPYTAPPQGAPRFGQAPRSRRDHRMLYNFLLLDKDRIATRDVMLARDCYDNNIAFLDLQLRRVTDALRARGLLDSTILVVTSDHGEAFGDHGIFGHANSLYLDELAVPLVIVAPGAPAGRSVQEPVSLRDIPATLVDLLGYARESPFPGVSLVDSWSRPPNTPVGATPAISEYVNATALAPKDAATKQTTGMQMSLVAENWHYVRDGTGSEQVFHLPSDPREQSDLSTQSEGRRVLPGLRARLAQAIEASEGSREVEAAYLESYRGWLKELVAEDLAGETLPQPPSEPELPDLTPGETSPRPD